MDSDSDESIPNSIKTSDLEGPDSPSSINAVDGDVEDKAFLSPWKKSDLILVVEESELHVHRLILTMQSPVFEAMLDGSFKESSQEKVELKDKCYEDMLAFLKLLYPASMIKSSELSEDPDKILSILTIADEFQAVDLIKNILAHNVKITAGNAMKILPFAIKYDQGVKAKCVEVAETSIATKFLEEDLPFVESDLAQEILLKKCQVLEDLGQRAHRAIRSLLGEWCKNTKQRYQCGLGHCVVFCRFHEAKTCEACLRVYGDKFCKNHQVLTKPGSYKTESLLRLLVKLDDVLQPVE